jgi:PKD repeat protein
VPLQDADLLAATGISSSNPLRAQEGSLLNVVVATFSDADPAGTVGDYTATINWGDGSTPTSGTIAAAAGGFTVSGKHAYDEEGTYQIQLTIQDQGGSSTTATSTAVIAKAVPKAGLSGPVDGVRGQPRTFTFTASHPSASDQAAGFVYTINWGDGTPLQTIPRTPGNGGGVSVDHIYTASGSYAVQVSATDDGGSTGTTSQTIVIRAVEMQGNSLAVGGTPSNDTIVVSPADTVGDLNVKLNGVSQGNFLPTDHILVYSQSGNDTIQLASQKLSGRTYYISVPAFLYGGGKGTDKDILDATGSTANNVLIGGAGTNQLFGGRGRDLLIASLGRSQLNAGIGEDILIGGWTDYDLSSAAMTYDHKLQALEAIMAEWGRTDLGMATDPTGYQARANDLLGPSAGAHQGGRTVRMTSTVRRYTAADSAIRCSGPAARCWIGSWPAARTC